MTAHEKAVEVAAQAGLAEHGCGYTIDGKQVHCDDPATDGHVDPYGNPLRRQHCECRAHSTAAITTYLASMEAQGWVMVKQPGSVAPPSTEIGEPKKAFADTFSAQTAMLAAKDT